MERWEEREIPTAPVVHSTRIVRTSYLKLMEEILLYYGVLLKVVSEPKMIKFYCFEAFVIKQW